MSTQPFPVRREPTDTERLKEAVDRLRRLETRFTRYLEAQGYDVGAQRPHWVHGRISVPSAACSLVDILSVVPTSWSPDEEIDVYVKDQFLASITTGHPG